MAWLRDLLVFDGFIAPEAAAGAAPGGDGSWLRDLLVFDGWLAPPQVQPEPTTKSRAVVPARPPVVLDNPAKASGLQEQPVAATEADVREGAIDNWRKLLGW